MNSTLLTPKVLREKGFEERLMFGRIIFTKGIIGVYFESVWIPCNMESGLPLHTNMYVNTWEELVVLSKKANIDIDNNK